MAHENYPAEITAAKRFGDHSPLLVSGPEMPDRSREVVPSTVRRIRL